VSVSQQQICCNHFPIRAIWFASSLDWSRGRLKKINGQFDPLSDHEPLEMFAPGSLGNAPGCSHIWQAEHHYLQTEISTTYHMKSCSTQWVSISPQIK
jgi:hypothetical protein